MYRVLHVDGEIYSYETVSDMLDGLDDAGYLLLENMGEQDFLALMDMWVAIRCEQFDEWWDRSPEPHIAHCQELSKIAVALIESAGSDVTLH